MNWGKWIILSFVAFAIFIFTLVAVCMREDVPLVSKSYYREELEYQEQIDRLNNTRSLTEKPKIGLMGDSLLVHYQGLTAVDSGRLDLFRPSDDHFDKRFYFHAEPSGAFGINVRDLPRGFYKVRMTWSAQSKQYFIEDTIQL